MTLGGFICLRNATAFDACWREAILSILPVCDVVSVSVSDDDPVTEEEVREWLKIEPKLSLNMYPWKHPVGNEFWYNEWLQYARQHTPTDMVFQIDWDEILDPSGYEEIRDLLNRNSRFSVNMARLNFWRDPQHLIPDGKCCAHNVIRIAPQDMYLASDGHDPKGWEVPKIAISSNLKLFHYGFIRSKNGFFSKERFLQKAYFNSWDKRLENAEKFEGHWGAMPGVTGWENDLKVYSGNHPELSKAWLRKNGFNI